MSLPVEADFISKKQKSKKDIFMAFSPSNFKIVLVLLAKVEILYVESF